jgi:hypothetical protein
LHPFDNQYVLFQYRGDDVFQYHNGEPGSDKGYSYWLLSLHSNCILINMIDCDLGLLKKAGGRGRCNDIKSRNVLIAVAKIAARHSLDLQKNTSANSDHAFAMLRIQDH